MTSTLTTLIIAAVCFQDDAGRVLTVRKHGTAKFMLPGGKLDAGETPLRAAIREVREEVGFELDPTDLRLLGEWLSPAANEANTQIRSTVYVANLPNRAPEARAEIAELVWLKPSTSADRMDLAPLLRDYVIPALS